MESTEKSRIELLAKQNPELRRLYNQHVLYHQKIDALDRRSFRTPKEERELKELKSVKLRGVERMLAIVNAHSEQGIAA